MTRPFRLLLFEDNEGDVYLVRLALQESGIEFELAICKDGEDAMRAVDRIEAGEAPAPDLLLLDMNMPRFGGDEVLGRLRRGSRAASCSVIVLTSSDSPADRARASALGVKHYFLKPADLHEFMKLGQIVRTTLAGATEGQADGGSPG